MYIEQGRYVSLLALLLGARTLLGALGRTTRSKKLQSSESCLHLRCLLPGEVSEGRTTGEVSILHDMNSSMQHLANLCFCKIESETRKGQKASAACLRFASSPSQTCRRH